MRKITGYFTIGETLLWCGSILLILATFVIFDRENYLTLTASLIGVTSLLFNAKGFLSKIEPHCQTSLSLFLFTQDYPC